MGRVFVCFCVGVASGPRDGVGRLWSSFGTPSGLFCWPFWGGGRGVGLALCCFVVCSAGRFVLGLILCCFVLVFFDPFDIAITSFGEERANLGAFHKFVLFAFVWVLSSSSWCLGKAVACDCGTPWTFLHFFSYEGRFAFQFIKNFYIHFKVGRAF